jgi:hypothetical protein
MNRFTTLLLRRLLPIAPLCAVPTLAHAQLQVVVTDAGPITLSTDGAGTNAPGGGAVSFDKPAGATVRSAYLAAASNGFRVIADGDVILDGVPIAWDLSCSNSLAGFPDFLNNVFADVTGVVAPTIDAAPAGIGSIPFDEIATTSLDGVALAVIFDDPNVAPGTSNGVLIFFGCQDVAGDTFTINLAEPIDLGGSPQADFGLGISYGFQGDSGSGQVSLVDVDGVRLSSSAGGEDDGLEPGTNGNLITVGGIGDSNANPADPNGAPTDFGYDDELYDLLPYYTPFSTQFVIDTFNPSNDDNIFWATLVTSVPAVAQGIVLGPVNAVNVLGDDHTVTATVTDASGDPVVGVDVTFTVTAGPNVGDGGSDTTDANGEATFTYTGDGGLGTDTIVACFTDSTGATQCSNEAFKTWVEACLLVSGDGPGSSTYTAAGHTFQTAIDAVDAARPVLLDDQGEISVALPSATLPQAPAFHGGGNLRRAIGFLPLVVRRLSAQVVMWNPAFAPSAPELSSNAVDVWVLATGQVLVSSYGTPDRMTLWVESRVEEAGIGGVRRAVLRFPFSIEGL